MLNAITLIVIFIFCAALASGGILVAAALRNSLRTPLADTLLYYEIFYFTYGFYAIWGQVIVYVFLNDALSPGLLAKTTNVLVLIGTPFMLLSWFMLIRFCRELVFKNPRPFFIAAFMAIDLGIIFLAGFIFKAYFNQNLFSVIKYCFVGLNFIFTATTVVYLLRYHHSKCFLRKRDMKNLVLFQILFVFILNGILLLSQNVYAAISFILVFFIAGAFIPLYMRYFAELPIIVSKVPENISFDDFCRKYEISSREKEIIREICNGLSNQQIADRLFISLQTVKDHTSRIYFKTNCNSRAMLMAMVRT